MRQAKIQTINVVQEVIITVKVIVQEHMEVVEVGRGENVNKHVALMFMGDILIHVNIIRVQMDIIVHLIMEAQQ